MKLRSPNRQHGGTLIVTLIMAITIGTVLSSYLLLVGSRYELTARSQCWNYAVPVLEAGIEEALTHLQDDASRPSANGWTNGTVGGQTVYAKQRSLSDGSMYYTVIYNAGTTNPYIYSTGMIPAPRKANTYISRTARVNGYNPPLFNVAFGAVNGIQMNGNGLAADSFNSSLSTLSNNGLYDSTKTSTNGNVASVNGPVDFGNHNIAGNLYLGPTVAQTNVSGVNGKIYSDFNISFPDVVLPNTTWSTPTKTTVNGVQVYDLKTSGDYVVPDNAPVIVESGATVRLQVPDASKIPSSIHVVATNGVSGNLSLYQVSGNGSIDNVTLDSGRAVNFYYYGLPGVTSITYSGNSTFTGAVYAPEASLTLNGGGNNIGFIGSVVVKSITMNGHYNFHFDEALLNAGPGRGLTITSWQEL